MQRQARSLFCVSSPRSPSFPGRGVRRLRCVVESKSFNPEAVADLKFNLLNRKIHNLASILIAVPIVIVIVSGLLLQVKKEFSWIQPAEIRGVGKTPEINFPEILEACKKVPEAKVESWDDINRLDVRPSRGMVKVRAQNDWEIQVDLKTGKVLQKAYRRSDLIESIHDGSFFHDAVKLWVFLPAGFVLFLLWSTGIYMFFQPRWARWRRSR